MTDNEIIDFKVGETTLGQMSAMSFLQWVAKKLDSTSAYSAAVVELRAIVSNPPMSRTIPDMEKISIVRKLLGCNIEL